MQQRAASAPRAAPARARLRACARDDLRRACECAGVRARVCRVSRTIPPRTRLLTRERNCTMSPMGGIECHAIRPK